MVYFVPEKDFVGGGVMSICGMHKTSKELKQIHGYDVIAVTLPNKLPLRQLPCNDCTNHMIVDKFLSPLSCENQSMCAKLINSSG